MHHTGVAACSRRASARDCGIAPILRRRARVAIAIIFAVAIGPAIVRKFGSADRRPARSGIGIDAMGRPIPARNPDDRAGQRPRERTYRHCRCRSSASRNESACCHEHPGCCERQQLCSQLLFPLTRMPTAAGGYEPAHVTLRFNERCLAHVNLCVLRACLKACLSASWRIAVSFDDRGHCPTGSLSSGRCGTHCGDGGAVDDRESPTRQGPSHCGRAPGDREPLER